MMTTTKKYREYSELTEAEQARYDKFMLLNLQHWLAVVTTQDGTMRAVHGLDTTALFGHLLKHEYTPKRGCLTSVWHYGKLFGFLTGTKDGATALFTGLIRAHMDKCEEQLAKFIAEKRAGRAKLEENDSTLDERKKVTFSESTKNADCWTVEAK